MNKLDGLWIPKEIWQNDKINLVEKVILSEIERLDNASGCFASNQHFAEMCQCSESTVTRAIKKITALGLISVSGFDGRTRKIHYKICEADSANLKGRLVKFTRQTQQIDEADSANFRQNNKYNNKSINKTSNVIRDELLDEVF